VPPRVRRDKREWPWVRSLWWACLVSLAVVLVLATLVAIGF
jgi:hypothetical protein